MADEQAQSCSHSHGGVAHIGSPRAAASSLRPFQRSKGEIATLVGERAGRPWLLCATSSRRCVCSPLSQWRERDGWRTRRCSMRESCARILHSHPARLLAGLGATHGGRLPKQSSMTLPINRREGARRGNGRTIYRTEFDCSLRHSLAQLPSILLSKLRVTSGAACDDSWNRRLIDHQCAFL